MALTGRHYAMMALLLKHGLERQACEYYFGLYCGGVLALDQYTLLGTLLMRNNQKEQATWVFEDAFNAGQDNPYLLLHLGELWLLQARYLESCKVLAKLVQDYSLETALMPLIHRAQLLLIKMRMQVMELTHL